ncbi:MAG: hypothetical protein ACFFEE_04080 [Candidatus Thorarchaeota archaeon]
MTGQIADQVRYNGEVYSLVGVNGEGLPVPADFGMKTTMASTACWRGYQMFYDCLNDELILDAMLANPDEVKPVNGVKPRNTKDSWGFNQLYENIGFKTKFTGHILVGRNFVQEMYVHMGFQSAESYRDVLELDVEDGNIVNVINLRDVMEQRRLQGRHKPTSPLSMEETDLYSWIEDRFSQDYNDE